VLSAAQRAEATYGDSNDMTAWETDQATASRWAGAGASAAGVGAGANHCDNPICTVTNFIGDSAPALAFAASLGGCAAMWASGVLAAVGTICAAYIVGGLGASGGSVAFQVGSQVAANNGDLSKIDLGKLDFNQAAYAGFAGGTTAVACQLGGPMGCGITGALTSDIQYGLSTGKTPWADPVGYLAAGASGGITAALGGRIFPVNAVLGAAWPEAASVTAAAAVSSFVKGAGTQGFSDWYSQQVHTSWCNSLNVGC
jgi:hypothetical protein